MRTKVPNIANAFDTSNPFTYLSFYLLHDCPSTTHFHQWTQPTQLVVIFLPLATPYSCTQLHFCLTLPVEFHSTLSISINFPLFPTNFKDPQNIKGKNKDKREETMKTNTIQQHKQSGMIMH